MKIQIPAAFLIILIAASGFAQDAEKPSPANNQTQTTQPQNPTQSPSMNMKGKLGLYLYSNTDFTQGNSIGGSIGAKYFILSKLAVRGGVTINNSGSGFERPRFDGFNNEQKFSFYAGAGGLYHFYSTHSSVIVNGVRINNQQQKLFGVGGLVGTEYNMFKKVNLTLEYNPTYLFGGRQNENNEIPGTNIRLPRQKNFNAGNFNLGAVYYFN